MEKNFANNEFNYHLNNSNNNYYNNVTNNIIQGPFQKNNSANHLPIDELRRIIKEEFNLMIKPYVSEIKNLKLSVENNFNNLNPNFKRITIENKKDINIGDFNNIDYGTINSNHIKSNNIILSNTNQNNSLIKINASISSLKAELDKFKEEMNLFKNESIQIIRCNTKKLVEFESKLKNLENDESSESDYSNKDEIKSDFNRDKYSNKNINDNNTINDDLEKKIYSILEKLNLVKLSDYTKHNFKLINESYANLIENYKISSKTIQNLNVQIKMLKSKLNEVSFSSKNRFFKEAINFIDNKGIDKKNNKNLGNKTKFLESKEEDKTLYNNKKVEYEEENSLMEQKLNILCNQMQVYNDKIEENSKKSQELDIVIDEIKKDMEDKKDNIKTNQYKLKNLEQIIIKLNEEKYKNLENKIIELVKKINDAEEKKKKNEEINNEINNNYKENFTQRINEIENRINNITEEISRNKIEKNINNIEELNENKILSRKFEKKINYNSDSIFKFEERLIKLEEKFNFIKRDLEEIKAKSNKNINANIINEIEKDNNEIMIEENNGENQRKEEEIKQLEKKEKKNDKNEKEIKNKNNYNLSRESKDPNKTNEEEEEKDQEYYKGYDTEEV